MAVSGFVYVGHRCYVGYKVSGRRGCGTGQLKPQVVVKSFSSSLSVSQECFLFLKNFSQCKSTGSRSTEAEGVALSHPGPGGVGMW